MYNYENEALNKGYKNICGVDEVGRGCLAGPVVASSVILDNIIDGIDDSKKLTDKKRRIIFEKLISSKSIISTSIIDNHYIDKTNILISTKKAMMDSISKLSVTPDILLIDAVKLDINIDQLSIIKGDTLSASIAAASIIAKVTRDNIMIEYSKIYPEYGFEKHKGYGTKYHIQKLRELGICDIHRKSFKKVPLHKFNKKTLELLYLIENELDKAKKEVIFNSILKNRFKYSQEEFNALADLMK